MSPQTLLLILLVALVFAVGFLFGILSDIEFLNEDSAAAAFHRHFTAQKL